MGTFKAWGINDKGETLLYLTEGFNAGIVNCETGKFKFFKRPQKGLAPVFDGENVIWK